MIVGINTGLIILGVAGIIPPTTSALLHNTSTLWISTKSMKNLWIEKKHKKRKSKGHCERKREILAMACVLFYSKLLLAEKCNTKKCNTI